jgi:hypothetical protein
LASRSSRGDLPVRISSWRSWQPSRASVIPGMFHDALASASLSTGLRI